MKVLHLNNGNDNGGAKTHIIQLLKELNKRIEVQLLCFVKADPFYSEAVQNEIHIEILEQKSRADLRVISNLIEKINKEKYDIIHCHGARANFIGTLIRRKISVPVITTIHSDYLKDFDRNLYAKWVYTQMNVRALNKMDYYVTVSEDFGKMLQERGFQKEQIYTVKNGIDFNHSVITQEKSEFLKKYKISWSEQDIFVGIAGRLVKVKGHEIFLKAASEVLKQCPNVKFLLAGDGEEKEELQREVKALKIEKSVFFLGFVEDMNSFYKNIDVNTLTSYTEGFPYAILEGARFKKPTISSAVGGIPELLKDEENGYLFNVGDFRELAQKLVGLVTDSLLRKKFGEQLYYDAKKSYSSESLANSHIRIYGDIMKKVQMKKKMILDVPVHHITMDNAVKRVFQFLEEDKNHIVYTPNPEIIMEAQSNLELKQALHNADLVIPDGIGVVIASHFYSDPLPQRVAGYDLVQRLFNLIAKKEKSVYFLGGKPGIVDKAKENMIAQYPGLKVVGVHHGYFSESEEKRILEDISKKSPDLLLVGLGAPRQEIWIHRLQSELCAKVTIGVGGSFDVMSGMVKRAPAAFQKLGLEWFYRLVTQPSRAKRMTRLPVFLIYALKERLRRKGESL